MTQVLMLASSGGALNSIKTLFDALGGLGGFIVAIIGVMIFLRDNDKSKSNQRRPRKRQPGVSHDHSNRPPQARRSPPPPDEDQELELSEDQDGDDLDGGSPGGEPADA